MKIGVISDIHSNPFALEAVLEDLDHRGVDTIICTGDLVGYMPFPNEVIQIIRARQIMTIQGNHDSFVARLPKLSKEVFDGKSAADMQKSASALYTREIITEDNYLYINQLPERIELTIGDYHLLFIHGSPRSQVEYMYEGSELMDEIIMSTPHNVIISGHTHLPYSKKIGDKILINAGSVGKPKIDSANGTYVILTSDGNTLDTEIIEVTYPIEKMVAAIRENPYISDGLISVLRPS